MIEGQWMNLSRRTIIVSSLLAAIMPRAALATQDTGVPPADKELRVPVPGGNIYVRVNGSLTSGRAPLIMVHGGPGGALWQLFPALPLAADRAIILYDQLDSGRSDAPGDKANWTVDRYASEIEAIRAALKIKAFHLYGHSWGGIVANRYAARRPAGLQSLTLQGTPLSAARLDASVRSLYDALPDGAGAIIERNERAGTFDDPAYGEAITAFMRKHLNRTSTKSVAMPYMASLPADRGDALAMAMTGGALAPFGGILKDFDDEKLLAEIAVPTLLLCGEFDIMTPAATRAMLPALKHGSFLQINGAGHMAQFDQPEAWRTAFSEFIAKSEGVSCAG